MILSPYSNPPYRTPTRTSSSSPPPDPSPKRKRTSSTSSLQIDTNAKPEFDGLGFNGAGPNSPRTKVADKLEGLNLDRRPLRPVVFGGNEGDAVARKRLQRGQGVRHYLESEGVGVDVLGTPKPDHASTTKGADAHGVDEVNEVNEVHETPDRRTKPSQPKLSRPPLDFDDSNFVTETAHTDALPSTPPQDTLQPADSGTRATSSLPSFGDISPDQAFLTWRDDEITGHELDPGGDDDGEGINGIGFRPTPAMAFMRQQRRRQQVNEWKAREARDARQRRIERRRRKGSEEEGPVAAVRKVGTGRVVRFADAAG